MQSEGRKLLFPKGDEDDEREGALCFLPRLSLFHSTARDVNTHHKENSTGILGGRALRKKCLLDCLSRCESHTNNLLAILRVYGARTRNTQHATRNTQHAVYLLVRCTAKAKLARLGRGHWAGTRAKLTPLCNNRNRNR
jgi:hypothetical protein